MVDNPAVTSSQISPHSEIITRFRNYNRLSAEFLPPRIVFKRLRETMICRDGQGFSSFFPCSDQISPPAFADNYPPVSDNGEVKKYMDAAPGFTQRPPFTSRVACPPPSPPGVHSPPLRFSRPIYLKTRLLSFPFLSQMPQIATFSFCAVQVSILRPLKARLCS